MCEVCARVSCYVMAMPILCAQNFTPTEAWYDVIWLQWVMAHLTDGMLCVWGGGGYILQHICHSGGPYILQHICHSGGPYTAAYMP